MLLLGFSKKVLLSYTFSNICCFFDFATFFNVGALAFRCGVFLLMLGICWLR